MSSALTVTRWRRYGKDRLYVSAADGSRVGWHDVVSGQTHVEPGVDREAVVAAVVGWRGGAVSVSAVPEGLMPGAADESTTERRTAVEPAAPPVEVGALAAVESDWSQSPAEDEPAVPADDGEDLAVRPAGAQAREQALSLRRAAPVRTLLARALGVHTEERAWRIGADGEEKVAAQLAKLCRRDQRWRVLHAIPVGERGADIDHLVIGPGGVFSLNAKHHPGAKVWVAGNTFLVNGARQPYLRNSRHEAQRASRLLTAAAGLPVVVTGVVVPVGADELVVKQAPGDVEVIGRMRLAGWLRARPETLDATGVDVVFQAARRSTTWGP